LEEWNTTINESEAIYTKQEVQRAKLARKFPKNSGYPCEEEAVRIFKDRNVSWMPEI
jgi:hypothetical protein